MLSNLQKFVFYMSQFYVSPDKTIDDCGTVLVQIFAIPQELDGIVGGGGNACELLQQHQDVDQ